MLTHGLYRSIFVAAFSLLLASSSVIGQFYYRPVYDTTRLNGVRYQAELSGFTSSNGTTPFWFRSNQFGMVPSSSPAGLVTIGAVGQWGDTKFNRKVSVKVGVEAVGNVTLQSTQLILPEAYAAVRWRHIELYAGRRREINGLTDTLLTSGSVAWSGNAVPITQIRLGTRDFAPLNFTKGLISINAFFSHGWFANTDSMQHVYLHAKSLFVRVGKPNWAIRFYGGINHYVQWGGYSKYLPPILARDGHIADNLSAYKSVVFPFGSPNGDNQLSLLDSLNQVGNHLGSIDFGTDIQLKQSNIFLYHQHIYEDNSGVKFQNFPDGLWGFRWKNLTTIPAAFLQLKQLTVEFLTTLNRSGNDPVYGRDDYFYNGQYIGGWSQKGNAIGTPLFTKTTDLPVSLRTNNPWFSRTTGVKELNITRPFNNNAVQSIHLGLYALSFRTIPIILLVTANKYYEWPNTKINYNQLYSSLEINNIPLGNETGLKLGVRVAYDTGEIFSSNVGAMATIRKVGLLKIK